MASNLRETHKRRAAKALGHDHFRPEAVGDEIQSVEGRPFSPSPSPMPYLLYLPDNAATTTSSNTSNYLNSKSDITEEACPCSSQALQEKFDLENNPPDGCPQVT
jgi:hypothetical protein